MRDATTYRAARRNFALTMGLPWPPGPSRYVPFVRRPPTRKLVIGADGLPQVQVRIHPQPKTYAGAVTYSKAWRKQHGRDRSQQRSV